VDASGRPVGGARVYFASGPGSFPDMAALTGEDGSFALAAPSAGTYAVQVHADGFEQATASVSLKAGDFTPGSWGQELIDALAPADINIEKIAYSAFHMSRLEWTLRKCGIEQLYFTGIVTNGGVASTVRDAHVREFHCTVIEDGCAAFGRPVHEAAIEGLKPVAKIVTVERALADFGAL